jgi:hypothetical protein
MEKVTKAPKFPPRAVRAPSASANEPGRREEWLVAVFALGCLLFSPLILQSFKSAAPLVAGVPPFILYVFAAWGALILLVAIVVESSGNGARSASSEAGRGERPRP